MKKAYWSLPLLALVVLPYFICNGEKESLDEAERARLRGRFSSQTQRFSSQTHRFSSQTHQFPEQTQGFLELSDGFVHYRTYGPPAGPPLVLVHGGTFPSICWDYNAGPLAAAGFYVITYDLFGRGLSDRPALRYDREVWDRQLGELIDKLAGERRVHLAGLSVGGGVVSIFTERNPDRVDRLVLLAPVGIPIETPPLAKLSGLPLLGEYIMNVAGDRVVYSRFLRTFEHPERYPELQRKFRIQMRYRGFKRSILSMLRHYPLNDLKSTFTALGRRDRPILLIWGDADVANPYANYRELQKLIPALRFHSVPGGKHSLQVEHADEVNREIIRFLGESAGQ